MTDKRPSWHMLLAAASCLALVPTARGQVNNRAGLFTLEAVKKADERIGEIKSRLGKWIVVDTFKEPPATEPKKNLENAELREKFFEEWARQRVAETGLKGVHVLWCQTPRHVQVTATAGTEDLFSPWSQHNLQRYLKKKLEPPPEKRGAARGEDKAAERQRANDDFLRETVAYVEGRFSADRAVGRVIDEAHLFKPDAIEKADRQIKHIRARFGTDLTIVTLKGLSEIDTDPYNLDNADQKRELFDEWVRARASRLDGIYVVICLDPKMIHIVVSEGTDFTDLNRRNLYRLLVDRIQPDNPDQGAVQGFFNKFRKKRDNNEGLLAAVDFVEAKLNANRPVDLTNWMFGMGAIAGILGVWIVLGLVRMRLRRRTPAEAGVHDADDSGRSIAVLGGGIGAVCGDWLFGRVLWASRKVARVVLPPPAQDHSGDSGGSSGSDRLTPKDSLRHDVEPGES